MPLIIGTILALIVASRARQSFCARLLKVTLALSAVIVVVSTDIPGTGFVRSSYFELLYPLRGVSNYLKILPLLLSTALVAAFSLVAQHKLNSRKGRQTLASFILVVASLWSVIDSIPLTPSFRERNSLVPVENFYRDISGEADGSVIAHFPDHTYDAEWGFPTRFIQLAHFYQGGVIANGRDYRLIYDSCGALPLPVNDTTLTQLQRRGVTQILLHARLIPPTDLEMTLEFLRAKRFALKQITSPASNDPLDMYRALDVWIADIPSTHVDDPCTVITDRSS
jgi:hypothetical protein